MEKVRIVFMGTPLFGKAMLQTLLDNDFNVVGVICQPDKPVGRKQVLTPCITKQYALENNIEVIQPLKIKQDYQQIIDLKPDLIVTCAYGQIIPQVLLDTPSLGCINIHASLLPKLRGGAPIQHSIIDGYQTTGITIMEMASKMDAGNIISQDSVEIDINDTYTSLQYKLIECAKQLLVKTMPSIINHSYTSIVQNENEVTFGYNISKEEEKIDFNKSYMQVFNQIRGLIEVPYAYCLIDDKKLKICEVEYSDEKVNKANGTIVFYGKELALVVDQQLIIIKQLQLEGKNKMSSRDFRNGLGKDYDNKVAQ